jgi:hypothetical protein
MSLMVRLTENLMKKSDLTFLNLIEDALTPLGYINQDSIVKGCGLPAAFQLF